MAEKVFNNRKSSISDSIKFGGFTFFPNPKTTELEHEMRYVTHEYIGMNNADIEPLGTKSPVIKLEGMFVTYMDGDKVVKATTQFSELRKIFREGKVRKMYHPAWYGDCYGLMIKCNGKIEAEKGIVHYDCEIVLDRGNGNGQSKGGKIKMKKQKKVTKTFYHTVQKNNQTLQKVIDVEKKKSKNKKYASQFTLANVKKWNKSIKNIKKIKKGTKVKFKYTVTTTTYVYV